MRRDEIQANIDESVANAIKSRPKVDASN